MFSGAGISSLGVSTALSRAFVTRSSGLANNIGQLRRNRRDFGILPELRSENRRLSMVPFACFRMHSTCKLLRVYTRKPLEAPCWEQHLAPTWRMAGLGCVQT